MEVAEFDRELRELPTIVWLKSLGMPPQALGKG